jgi:hypothetical protein
MSTKTSQGKYQYGLPKKDNVHEKFRKLVIHNKEMFALGTSVLLEHENTQGRENFGRETTYKMSTWKSRILFEDNIKLDFAR